MMEYWLDDARTFRRIIRNVSGVTSVTIYGDRVHVAMENRTIAESVKENLRIAGMIVKEERRILPSLEDVFIAKVGD